ncbi:hypothetical protein HUG10_21000 (plasmid) [Halorarum halophilum]|uniref:Uncharacterized protein n=1 Tax=Halorarum halophilum TaxID=2743090 RepID=A0A7D5GET6_9EURY|nr:hypothetical protein [Halobaculum halophilum]QLG30066.1 hypothetical protein HUG10_21000 [Halobaculum halophilum]
MSRIYDRHRYEYPSGKVSLDFRLDVPKAPHEDLKSSATMKDGLVDDFELRLGLLSQEQYTADEIRETMEEILRQADLPRTRHRAERQKIIDEEVDEYGLDPDRIPDVEAEDEIDVKLGYDPHWGELGFYQIHLKCHSFFPPVWREDEFMDFVEEYTDLFVDAFDWEETDG